MLRVSLNDKHFQVEQDKDNLLINDKAFDWDMVEINEGRFHIIKDNQSFTAEVIKADYVEKSFQIKVGNKILDLVAKDRFDLLLEKLGMSGANDQKINDLKAPMPGLILDILVAVGDQVTKGDKLLILEAMKMENIIKAAGEGTIKQIKAEKGNNVEKNQVLIVFE